MLFRELGKTGLRVSVIGFGASPLGNEFGEIDAEEGTRAVHAAVDEGINFFDVAPYYGRTVAETRLGQALVGRRQQVVLATKCGRYDKAGFDFSAKRVLESVDESLRRLRTDYIDLFQAHDIEFGDLRQVIDETVPALQRLKQSGKVRFIGITGFPLGALRRVAMEVEVDTILSYCRLNLLVDDLKTELAEFVAERRIGLINASPLHMGMLTESGPPAWHPAPAQVGEAARGVVAFLRERGLSVERFALRYCLDFSLAASTIVGMSTEAQVRENLLALETPLDADVVREVQSRVSAVKNLTWPTGRPENQDGR